ncbi:MAG: penicillin binding protein PBP4B [Treponema sp.]
MLSGAKRVKIFIVVLSFIYNYCCYATPTIYKDISKIFEEEDNPQIGLQVDTIYTPNPEYTSESILPHNFINFTGYEGQGNIYIKANNIESFNLYLNGSPIETTKICKIGQVRIDVSNDLKNGRNILSLSQIKYIRGLEENTYIRVRMTYPTLIKGSVTGVNNEGIKVLETFIEEEVKNGFPGCQLFIAKNGKILKNASYGYLSTVDNSGTFLPFKKRVKVTEKTLYDIASNTKIYSVNFALQRLVYEKKISLDDKVVDFFPSFTDSKKARIKGKEKITIKDLLLHQSGFPAGLQFLQNKKLKEKSDDISNKEATLEIIMDAPLVYKTGTDSVYSDVGYMLLGLIIEKVTSRSLDEYVKSEIYKPLGLKNITYKPLQNNFKKTDCAATEISLAKRSIWKEEFSKTERGVLQGVVHDGNAYFAMNQVSGHAGVFSNAESIGVLAQVILNGGGYGDVKLFDEGVADMFSAPQGGWETQSLGWRRQGSNYYYSWAFSRLADKDAIGHTGWTGSLTLIDRKENLIIVLLTNAKNTPLVKGKEAKGRFEGDFYLLKNYCVVPSFIYATLNNYSTEHIDNMLIELFEQRTILHKKHSFYQNNAFLNDLYALYNTIKRLSGYSRTFKTFLKNEETKQILDYIEGVTQS